MLEEITGVKHIEVSHVFEFLFQMDKKPEIGPVKMCWSNQCVS